MQERLCQNLIAICKVASEENLAPAFTKGADTIANVEDLSWTGAETLCGHPLAPQINKQGRSLKTDAVGIGYN